MYDNSQRKERAVPGQEGVTVVGAAATYRHPVDLCETLDRSQL